MTVAELIKILQQCPQQAAEVIAWDGSFDQLMPVTGGTSYARSDPRHKNNHVFELSTEVEP